MGSVHDVLVSAAAGAGLFAVVGLLFGSLAGALAWSRGQASGGFVGHAVADTLARLRGKEFSPFLTGAIVGACDGALFLACLGLLAGVGVAASGPGLRTELLLLPLRATVILAIAALVLGALAYFLIWGGARAVGFGFSTLAGAVVGEVLEARVRLDNGLLYGLLAGAAIGLLAAVFTGPAEPEPSETSPQPNPEAGDGPPR